MSKLWQSESDSDSSGQQQEEIARMVETFTVGNDYQLDAFLLPYDLKASGVHLQALEKAGYLTATETAKLQEGLDRIMDLWETGDFEILPEHEDGHTAIELWLTQEYGEIGKKIHTGRSRNDQVLTAMRLYEKHQLERVREVSLSLADAMLKVAENHRSLPMPGYTHTRKAMLSSVAQWMGGFAEMVLIQIQALDGVCGLVDRSPLGTAAGFGSTVDLDRTAESDALGFSSPLVCATTAQLSRGLVELQVVQALAGLTVIPARLSSDLIQFSGQAYGYIDMDPVFCTGSSIMPNKKNPDVAELIRGRHAEMIGHASTLQAVTANLGGGYHRDLQLTKEPVIRAFESALSVLSVCQAMVGGLVFDEKKLRESCTADLMAAEEAYRRVRDDGLSFRDAYRAVKEEGSASSSLSPDELLDKYTQLGSPGRPGLEHLRRELDELSGKVSS